MRIVIDMQGAQTESRFRGIGRYTMSLAQAIVRNRGGHEIILLLNGLFPDTIEPIRIAFAGLLPLENIRVWHAPGPVHNVDPRDECRRNAAELIREAYLASLQPDIVLLMSLFEGFIDDAVTSIGMFTSEIPTIVILYDLIPLLNPEVYLKPHPAFESSYLRKIEFLKKAAAWLAISESAGKEGRDKLGLANQLVKNISTACDSSFQKITVTQQEKEELQARLGISRSIVLYTGGADDRKNLPSLIRAYARLSPALRESHQLVFAGKMPAGHVHQLLSEAKSASLRADELIFTGYICDNDLIKLYNICKLFVFPSWHEGFGLPALEAMSCGAAVIAADTSSLPEVVGRADARFNPFDVSAITAKITHVLENELLRLELAEYGLEQAKRFSWDESARRALDVIETVKCSLPLEEKSSDTEILLKNLIQRLSKVLPATVSDNDILSLAHTVSCIRTKTSPKQLFVDISELVQRDSRTGVQRVTRNILKELLASPPDGFVVEPVYATSDRIGYRYARNFVAQFCDLPGKFEDVPIDYQAGDIFFGLDLQHHVVIAQKAWLKSMWLDGVKTLFLVHDLLPITLPLCFEAVINVVHIQWLMTLAEFDGVICVSKTVADEFTIWMAENGPKRSGRFTIDWSHNGADLDISKCSEEVLPDDANKVLVQLGLQPTFLSVGTIEPRKGQSQTLKAFEILWGQGIQANLVLVGKQGWMVESLVKMLRSHPELGERLFWLEGISDGYLEKVYSASTCLIAASFGEGFGLPLVEAAQRKLPIIARDIPIFREVAGEHAFYFRGDAPTDISEAVKVWMEMYHSSTHPKSDNMPWLTWRESTEKLVSLIIRDT